ncbi:MAG: hypothetical protein ABI585_03570 [Betaproteobacteria bacterium]
MPRLIPRRFPACLALCAMLASPALPLHATPMPLPASMGVGGDLCVGGKLVPAAPASPIASHDCEACCGTMPFALPDAPRSSDFVALAPWRVAAIAYVSQPSAPLHAAPARAPPAS